MPIKTRTEEMKLITFVISVQIRQWYTICIVFSLCLPFFRCFYHCRTISFSVSNIRNEKNQPLCWGNSSLQLSSNAIEFRVRPAWHRALCKTEQNGCPSSVRQTKYNQEANIQWMGFWVWPVAEGRFKGIVWNGLNKCYLYLLERNIVSYSWYQQNRLSFLCLKDEGK